MKTGYLVSFIVGLVFGAGLLFGIEHTSQISGLFRSPAEIMQANASGSWRGKVEVEGRDVPFSLAVKKNGSALSGVITADPVGVLPCDSVAVDPVGNITFSAHVDDKAATFTGKLAPDAQSMTGTLSGSVGSGDWSLAKNKS